MLQQDQQQRQKFILTSDIRLLEKQKRELLESIERMDASKKEEYRQFTQEIKLLTNRRNEISEQIERARDVLGTLTEAYNKSKEGMESYVKEHLDTAHKEATTIINDAKVIEKKAVDLHNTATLLQEENNNRKINLDRQQELNEKLRSENAAASIALDTRREVDQKAHQQHEETLHKLQVTIRELEDEILSLGKTKEALIIEIGETKQSISKELHEAKEKNIKADQMLISLNQRARTIAEQEQYIREETRLLTDRRGQLERAIEEFRAKGVSV